MKRIKKMKKKLIILLLIISGKIFCGDEFTPLAVYEASDYAWKRIVFGVSFTIGTFCSLNALSAKVNQAKILQQHEKNMDELHQGRVSLFKIGKTRNELNAAVKRATFWSRAAALSYGIGCLLI